MSCIIKLPTKNSKGVVSITNNEFKDIKSESDLIHNLKKNWILLYHPNYYDYKFENKKIFDGYLAWSETFNLLDDLNFISKKSFFDKNIRYLNYHFSSFFVNLNVKIRSFLRKAKRGF